MNEIFAAEPTACKDSAELRLLLRCFGPLAGRYLAAYPKDWFGLTEATYSGLSQNEQGRIKVVIRRACEASQILSRSNLAWDDTKDWISNAAVHAKAQPPAFNGLVTHEPKAGLGVSVIAVADLDLPPTAEERVHGIPQEYARVCRTLLVISQEVHFIDPYLDIRKKSVGSVVESLFGVAALGKKCRTIKLWARYSSVVGNTNCAVASRELEARLRELAKGAGLVEGTNISYQLMRDEDRQSKMHGRYVLSYKGGIRIDQGFQRLPQGREVEVGPIGERVLDGLKSVYLEGKNDLELVHSLDVTL